MRRALEAIVFDVRYGLRTLRADRAFTIVAIAILALGIGANVAVFSVVNTILLRPLPFPQPSQLVWIAPPGSVSISGETYSAYAYEEFVQRTRSFQGVTGYFAFSTAENYRLTGRGEPVPVTGIMVIGNFFQVLGVQPEMGRLFSTDETLKNSSAVTIVTDAFWRRRLGGDRDIVGKVIDLTGKPTTVIGVLPPSFDFGAVFAPGSKVDLFTPAIFDEIRDWGNTVTLIGRLRPDTTIGSAQAETSAIAPELYFNPKYPESKGSYKLNLTPLKEHVSGKLRRSLIMLWLAVGSIMLIVCVNLSNLLLVRAVGRSQELAVRSALGAARSRLVAQLLTESFLLAWSSGIVGLGIAFAITRFLAHQGSIALPLLASVGIDRAAFGWSVLVASLAAVSFGVIPSVKMVSGNLFDALKSGGNRATQGRRHERLRAMMVVTEVALAAVLLVGAGLLLRSFLRMLDIDLGFQPARAAALKVDYDDGDSAERRGAIFQQIVSRAESIPGVEAAGIVDYLPLGQNRSWGSPRAKGKTYRRGELPSALVYVVSPGYFRAMGMRLRGRDFSWSDTAKSEHVMVMSEVAARYLWPGEDAVGKIAIVNQHDTRVIGVVADAHQSNVEGAPAWQSYFSAMQEGPNGAELVVRTRMSPATLATPVLKALRELNPNQPASEFQSIETIVERAVSPRRFFMLLVTSFAALGLTLAALGVYGVISYSVSERTQEIGIRMALGATDSRICFEVIRRALSLVALGIGVGFIASLAAARAMASLLFGTQPNDMAAFAGMVAVLGAVALLAGYIPARRASRIEPMVALRSD
jgi:predicted permease